MGHAALVLVIPLIANAFVALAWQAEAPHLFAWGLLYILGHLGVQVLGGFVGVRLGRPSARLAVRIILPPSLRPRLVYLWLVDGKPLPRC